jgi:hypothetical protein
LSSVDDPLFLIVTHLISSVCDTSANLDVLATRNRCHVPSMKASFSSLCGDCTSSMWCPGSNEMRTDGLARLRRPGWHNAICQMWLARCLNQLPSYRSHGRCMNRAGLSRTVRRIAGPVTVTFHLSRNQDHLLLARHEPGVAAIFSACAGCSSIVAQQLFQLTTIVKLCSRVSRQPRCWDIDSDNDTAMELCAGGCWRDEARKRD